MPHYNNCHQNIGYLIQNRSGYGDFTVAGSWYDESTAENYLKHFVLERAIFEQGACFPKLCSFIK